jgi:hypothetical protein
MKLKTLSLLLVTAFSQAALGAGTTAIRFLPGLTVSNGTAANTCQIVSGDYTLTFSATSACNSSLLYATGGLNIANSLVITNNNGELFNLDQIIVNAKTAGNTVTLSANNTSPYTFTDVIPVTWTPVPLFNLIDQTQYSLQSSTNAFDLYSLILTSTSAIPYQTLSGFDVPNNTNAVGHGFEIVLDGILSTDVTAANNANYGKPTIMDNTPTTGVPRVTIVYQSTYDFTNNAWTNGTTINAKEHFGYTVNNKTPTAVSYHWLVDDGITQQYQQSWGGTVFGELTLAPVKVDITAPSITLTANNVVTTNLAAPLFDGVAQAIPDFPSGANGLYLGYEIGETFVAEVPSVIAGIFISDNTAQNCIFPYCSGPGAVPVSPTANVTATLYAGAGVTGTVLDSRNLTITYPFNGFADVDYGALGIMLTPGQTYTLTVNAVDGFGWSVPSAFDLGFYSYMDPSGAGCPDGVYPYGMPVAGGVLSNGKACQGDVSFHVIPSQVNAAANKRYGDAVWVRVFKNDDTIQRQLSDLVAGGQYIPVTSAQLEQDYILLQDAIGGTANNLISKLSTLTVLGSQTRNYEFYAYTGAYNASNHLATNSTAASRGGLFANNYVAIDDTAIAPVTTPVIQPISLQTAAFPVGNVGVSYLSNISAAGGSGPLSINVTGLPVANTASGLQWNAATATISGVPELGQAGVYPLTITVSDAAGNTPATGTVTLTINPAPAVVLGTVNLPTTASTQSPYSGSAAATGGFGNLTWSATGLPSGLTISSTGVVSGTPTATGVFTYTLTATDGLGQTINTTGSITVTAPIVVTASLPAGTVGVSYNATETAKGGNGSISWSATGLPAGLSISTSGVISGTPSTAGSSSVILTAKDSLGISATVNATLSIAAAPAGTGGSATCTVPKGATGGLNSKGAITSINGDVISFTTKKGVAVSVTVPSCAKIQWNGGAKTFALGQVFEWNGYSSTATGNVAQSVTIN